MKSVAAATTLFLAASAFVIPGFGQKRSTDVEMTIASKHQARNKPVNLPRNKAPAPKKAATAMTKPKKNNAKTSTTAQKKPTSASEEDMEEDMAEGDEKTVDNDAAMDEKTADGDANKDEAQVEHEHVRRAGKSAPKKAATKPKKTATKPKKTAAKMPTSSPSTEDDAEKDATTDEKAVDGDEGMVEKDDKSYEKTADKDDMAAENDADKDTDEVEHEHTRRANRPAPKKAAAKPAPKKAATKPAPKKAAAKPAPKKAATQPAPNSSAQKQVKADEDQETHSAESDEKDDSHVVEAAANTEGEHVEEDGDDAPEAEDIDEEDSKPMKIHARAQAKAGSNHAKVQPKKAATQPKKAAAKPKKAATSSGGPIDFVKSVETKLLPRATYSKPAPKKAATKPAPKKAATRPTPKKAAAKSATMEKTPVEHVEDHSPLNSVSAVGKAAANLRARDDTVAPTDVQILQYALTLEHLENAFYHGALEKFSQKAFVQGGLPSFARKRFEQIAEHEASHVAFLTSALGDQAVAPCEYSFPYTDPKSFAALSMILEGVGVSAYLGAAQYIENKEYLTAAGSILTTEARHASWISGAVNKQAPWSGPYDTPLSLDEVYSLAAGFITSCPSTNPALPVKAFPQLVVDTKNYKAGDTITLDFDETEANGEPTFLALFSGLNTTYAAIENKQATLPEDLLGTVYGVITTNGTAVNDENTIAGVAIFGFYENY